MDILFLMGALHSLELQYYHSRPIVGKLFVFTCISFVFYFETLFEKPIENCCYSPIIAPLYPNAYRRLVTKVLSSETFFRTKGRSQNRTKINAEKQMEGKTGAG